MILGYFKEKFGTMLQKNEMRIFLTRLLTINIVHWISFTNCNWTGTSVLNSNWLMIDWQHFFQVFFRYAHNERLIYLYTIFFWRAFLQWHGKILARFWIKMRLKCRKKRFLVNINSKVSSFESKPSDKRICENSKCRSNWIRCELFLVAPNWCIDIYYYTFYHYTYYKMINLNEYSPLWIWFKCVPITTTHGG